MHRIPTRRRVLVSVLTISICFSLPGVSQAGDWGEKWGQMVWGGGGGIAAIPALTTWGFIALLIMMSVGGVMALRRRRRQPGQ